MNMPPFTCKVLVGMAKRIDARLAGDSLLDQASLERVLASLHQA